MIAFKVTKRSKIHEALINSCHARVEHFVQLDLPDLLDETIRSIKAFGEGQK